MLTRLVMRNFKRFAEAGIDLGQPVVLIGPNNMGKTTALQALTLWDAGLRAWITAYGTSGKVPRRRPGVTINRKDLMALPIPSALLLWKDLHVREITRPPHGKQRTKNVRIEIVVEGISQGAAWTCGLEFDYANEESFYCRSLRVGEGEDPERMAVPEAATTHRIAYLPSMSGLADREFVKQAGEISVLIGQGQTAQVLRNLCQNLSNSNASAWERVVESIRRLFGVELLAPLLNRARSEITLAYRELNGRELDISCSGRGLQQTLLLLAYLYANPRSALLLDEPDAHLEILRQRQTFQLLTDVAESQGSQIIAASHSEVVMNEAATRGRVVAFVGRPHTINDKGSQLLKALTELGFDQYYQAEQKGWVLYLENTTDLDILRVFADTLGHPAREHLSGPFLHPVATNLPQRARDHFFGLREAKGDLVGIAIFDRLDKELQQGTPLAELMWQKREIENYLCRQDVLEAFSTADIPDGLFGHAQRQQRLDAMRAASADVAAALRTLGKPDPWSPDIKATDDFLDPLFKAFSSKLGVPLVLRKNEYHKLARFVPKAAVDCEIVAKLDAVAAVAAQARPSGE